MIFLQKPLVFLPRMHSPHLRFPRFVPRTLCGFGSNSAQRAAKFLSAFCSVAPLLLGAVQRIYGMRLSMLVPWVVETGSKNVGPKRKVILLLSITGDCDFPIGTTLFCWLWIIFLGITVSIVCIVKVAWSIPHCYCFSVNLCRLRPNE